MSESVRCFMAVDFEEADVRRKLVSALKTLERTGADLRPVEPENIHITLRFLGETRQRVVDEVIEQVSTVELRPFRAEIRGVGVFPGLSRPRVIWAGCRKGEKELEELYSQIESRLRGLGIRPEDNQFHPHLTLARVRSGRNRDQLVEQITKLSDEDFGEIVVNSFQLKKSTLTPRGPIYATMKSFAARGG